MLSQVLCSCSALPLRSLLSIPISSSSSSSSSYFFSISFRRSHFASDHHRVRSREPKPPAAAMLSPGGGLAGDVGVSALTAGVALGLLRLFEELAERRVFEQKLNRKLVHITIGMVFLLFWPFFSSGRYAPFLAALAPGINIFRMLLLGLGVWKNEAMVKSISRHGDYRELLKGPLYYAVTITLATSILWRTSPIAIALVCNLCAGDGTADIVGRQFGKEKLPYNPNKSYAGSIAFALAGFMASIGYMHYFHMFSFLEESWYMIFGFFVVSLAAAIVESLPISTKLDDNLTVPFTSFLVGVLVF